jgi:carboxyl-terminal processing protease
LSILVIDPEQPGCEGIKRVRDEWVLRIAGEVRARREGTVNPDLPTGDAELLLQGDSGTPVEFMVLRVRRSEPQKMSVMRAPIAYPSVTSRLQGTSGIIQVQTLQAGRVKDVAAEIASLEKQGAKRLVLDLRHCSTGPDEEGVALANLFMDSGLITYTQGQRSSRQDFQAAAGKAVTKAPLAVIVNHSTAGAAEIAAAALMNSKRAQVVGERRSLAARVRMVMSTFTT